MKKHQFAAILATALAAIPAQAHEIVPVVPTLSLSVEGHVTRTPDIVDMSGGVITNAQTATAAMAENATRMSAVVAAIRKAGIAERDIQTSGFSLSAQYKYVENQSPILVGYQASNTVNLRVRKINEAGKLIDTLVKVGANQISGPNFGVEDYEAALDAARIKAVSTARSRAELYAKASGLHIKRIVSVSENGGNSGPQPMLMTMRAEKMADSSPIAPGEVQLGITVNMVFELE